jgi:hypothetical protein
MATAVARGGQVGRGRGGGGVVDGADSHEGRGEGTVGTLGGYLAALRRVAAHLSC